MSRNTLLSLSTVLLATLVDAQSSSALTPLASRVVPYTAIPYQVVGDQGGPRGPQFGYNECNSTTQNQNSLCQTLVINNMADFCMWSSSEPNDTIGESEAREVAWCTNPTRGTRVIPPGVITGAQWLYAENYIQIVGFLDQSKLNLDPTDEGGELDDYGADQQGNPLGALVYTNAFGMKANDFDKALQGGVSSLLGSANEQQNIFWVDFIGSGVFCLKACNPSNPNADLLCNHIYDEVGCTYNAVADYNNINGTFTVCDSTDMEQPGQYVGADGATSTWLQPLNGPLGTVPYTPTQVSSSNCHTYQSSELFAAAATYSAFSGSSAPTSSPTGVSGKTSASGTGGSTTSRASSGSGSGPTPSQTGSSDDTNNNAAIMGTVVPFVIAGFATFIATVATMLA